MRWREYVGMYVCMYVADELVNWLPGVLGPGFGKLCAAPRRLMYINTSVDVASHRYLRSFIIYTDRTTTHEGEHEIHKFEKYSSRPRRRPFTAPTPKPSALNSSRSSSARPHTPCPARRCTPSSCNCPNTQAASR